MFIISKDEIICKDDDHNCCPWILNFRKVREKPVVVDACQMEDDFVVETLEGTMKGKAGDWLIKGVNGEYYPCDKDIFEKTYSFVLDIEMEKEDFTVETDAGQKRKDETKHKELKVAVEDLLLELRIGPAELRIMSHGYSPDYPGMIQDKNTGEPVLDNLNGHSKRRTYSKVQLSQVVAKKLIDAGVLSR